MNATSVRFTPWVGSEYLEGHCGLRTLLVCESHYGDKKHERPTVTPEIIKALALGEKHPRATGKLRRHPHFTKIMSALMNVRQSFTREQKRQFWNSVAYYNFLQEFISATRVEPSKDAWERGKAAFSEVLDVLKPDLIICLSMRNGGRVRTLAGDIPVAVVNHPSARFAYSTVNPLIANCKEIAAARKVQIAPFASSEAFIRWCDATLSALPTPGSHLSPSDKTALLEARRNLMAAVDDLVLS
jgi:hypothetical protein